MSTELQSPDSAKDQHVYHRRGALFIVSAPSGAGKTTLCKRLMASLPGIWHSVSYTTRKPRAGEEGGREYFFIEEPAFQEMIERREFLEYAQVYGHWYGTPRQALMDKMEQGVDVLLEIDVQGALQIKQQFDDAVCIFILPPSLESLRIRLHGRGSDSPEEIQRRLEQVKEEVRSFREYQYEYQYIVRNDDLGQSLRELQSIFVAERLKTERLDMSWFRRHFPIAQDVEHDRETP